MSSKVSRRNRGIITVLITSFLTLLSCGNDSTKDQISKVKESRVSISNDDSNRLEINGSYTRDSQDFFGVEALVFDGNTVRFSVASLYALGQIVDREDITGTYTATLNGNVVTIELDFNTNFVFVDYLIDGSSKGGKSIKEVNVPYIIKGTKTNDGEIVLKDWESSKEKEKRLKRDEIENNKEEVIEDYGIDKNTILGSYRSSNDEKGVSVQITSIDELEVTKIRKKGNVSGLLKTNDIEKEFTSDYETGYEGNKYTFSIDYKDDRGSNRGILFVFENGLEANFYNDSGASKRFGLEKVEKTDVKENISTIQYYKINDPDGYSNLREEEGGKIIRKVYENEKFEVMSTEGNYKKVKLSDGTIGYIHSSRVLKIEH